VHDVGVHGVPAGRQRGQPDAEGVGGGQHRVHVGEGVEGGLAHEEDVHQLAVVGDERSEPAGEPLRVDERDLQPWPVRERHHRCVDPERLESQRVVGRRLRVPPPPAACQRHEHDDAGDDGGPPAPCPGARVGLGTRLQHALAGGRTNDGDEAGYEEQPEQHEHPSESGRHGQGFRGNGRYGHDGGAGADVALDGHVHAVRSPLHEPQLRGVQPRRAGHRLRLIGPWRALQPEVPGHRADQHPGHALLLDAHGDVGEPRHDAGVPDHHLHRPVAGVAAEMGVRVADVCAAGERRQHDERRQHAASHEAAAAHR
jgi:hypothetical protein